MAGFVQVHLVRQVEEVRQNRDLVSIGGFNSLPEAQRLEINFNDSLADLAGFDALEQITLTLTIENNLALPFCEAIALQTQVENALGIGGTAFITAGNDDPCLPDPCARLSCSTDCTVIPLNYLCQS